MNSKNEYPNIDGDAEELAARLLDMPDYVTEAQVAEELEKRAGISISQFDEVADLLLLAVPIMQDPLSGEWYHTLGYMDGEAWRALMKKKLRAQQSPNR